MACAAGSSAFCEDFDTSGAVPTWDQSAIDPKGSLSVSALRATSAPASLLSTMAQRSASDAYAQATLRKEFVGWRRIVLEFDIFVEPPAFSGSDVNSGIVDLYFRSATSSDGVALGLGATYTTLGIPGKLVNSSVLVEGAWQHARFDVDPTGSATGSIGAVSWKGTFPALVAGSAPTMGIDIGVDGFNRPAPEFRVFYDNVTVDFP